MIWLVEAHGVAAVVRADEHDQALAVAEPTLERRTGRRALSLRARAIADEGIAEIVWVGREPDW